MADFSRARVGDKCWSIQLGECEISDAAIGTGHRYPIMATNGSRTETYMLDGKRYKDDEHPSLFHSKPEFTDPPPAKRMEKVKGWVPVWKNINNPTQYYVGPFLFSSEHEAKLRYSEYIAIFPIEFEVEDDD